MRSVLVALVLEVVMASGAPAAGGYYTEAKLAAMRENLERYDWARQQRDQIVSRANRFVDWPPERLRALIPPPQVPRAYVVHEAGCPVHGQELNKIGRYSWIVDPDLPWKVRCPVGKEVYPSNDFGAYLAGGMKDRSLLTGEYADDGWGWRREGEPKKYWFVGCYAHWLAERFLIPALRDLSRAWLLTDDPRYARACGILLRQLADYYPDYFYERQSRYGTEFHSHYLGRLLYHTWECFTAQAVGPAYDAVRPVLDPGDRAVIETRLLRQMATDIIDGTNRIQGNYGMHQEALLQIAVTLKDTPGQPSSRDMLDWVLGNLKVTQYTSVGFEDALYNLIHRDGYPFESPSYNVGWMENLAGVADLLEEAGVEVYSQPRFRKLLEWPLHLACAGEFTPPNGDSNNLFAAVVGWVPEVASRAVEHWDHAAWARAMTQVGASYDGDLFRRSVAEKATRAAERHPDPVGLDSSLLPGVGFASLQTGSDANRIAAALFYGQYMGHQHNDRLQLDLFAHRNSLIPDFGYPETADSYDPRRAGFFEHTVSHNTVMVDATNQTAARGRLHVFDPGPGVQLVEASAEDTYPGLVSLYRRTLILVDAGPDRAYLVDLFRVRGGSQHDWLVHGTQAEFAQQLGLGPVRATGTLAGPEVPYGQFYDDPARRDKPVGTVTYHGYRGSGFQFLFNVQEAAGPREGWAEWRLTRPENLYPNRPTAGVALRAHLLGGDHTVLAADGRPQIRRSWPETVKWLIRRRVGQDLESVFVTVFEPYRDQPFIRRVTALPCRGEGLPVALEVELDGRVDRIVSRLSDVPGTVTTADGTMHCEAAAAVLSRIGGKLTRSYVLDGSAAWGDDRVTGRPADRTTVAAVDYGAGEITLADAVADSPAGNVAIVASDHHAAAVPFAKAVGPNRFAVGDDDLTAGRYAVTGGGPDGLAVVPPYGYFSEPGMTIADEREQVVGRLATITGGRLQLAGAAPELPPDANGDGARRVWIRVVGPGDRVTLHHSARAGG